MESIPASQTTTEGDLAAGRLKRTQLRLARLAWIALAVLYEQLAKDLLNRLTGERLDAQALSTANRVSSFLDDRFYQLSALSNHPNMPDFIADPLHPAGDVDALLKLESELPFLYGLLFFDENDVLRHGGATLEAKTAEWVMPWSDSHE